MIASLTGTVTAVGPTSAVIGVGGIGLLALCSPDTLADLRVGQPVTLATSLIVREDSLTLYGFGSAEERDLFELLQTATGVGPRLAQAALAVLNPSELRHAVATENLVALTKVPGIGRKGAQRLVIELKDKLGPAAAPELSAMPTSPNVAVWREQVGSGLQGLGWSARDADAACDRVAHLAGGDPEVSVAVLMRAALQSLARP